MTVQPSPDLRRLHAITANYFFWQGLRWVPPGAALVLFVWSTMPSFPLPAAWRDATPWFALTLGLVASWLIVVRQAAGEGIMCWQACSSPPRRSRRHWVWCSRVVMSSHWC